MGIKTESRGLKSFVDLKILISKKPDRQMSVFAKFIANVPSIYR